MPPSAKRGPRAKRQLAQADDETPNASPSHPAKRRRKTKEEPVVEPVRIPKTQAELNMSEEDLVASVSQHLALPDHLVQVAEDNSNAIHQRQGTNVAAYAKITGQNWTFYVKRVKTNVGRPPEGYIPPIFHNDVQTSPAASNEGLDIPAEETESSRIHIDLGPNKLVSRLHAEIFFDPPSAQWFILVNGRNGIKVDDQPIKRGQKTTLRSGRVIEVAGTEMMFVLPENEGKVVINDIYLRRAGLIQPSLSDPPHKETDATIGSSSQSRSGGPSMRPVLAPAPPDYRRPDTPVRARNKMLSSTNSPAFGTGGGSLMLAHENIDYSLEQNAHIKPPYTYTQLITQAIQENPEEKETLYNIYEFCSRKYAFYRRKETQKGWQNSIRHNLSLCTGFKLRPRESHEPGKGGYWGFDADMRAGLIEDAYGAKGGSSRRSPKRSPKTSNTPSPGKSGRTLHGPGDRAGGSPSRRVKPSSRSESPPLGGYPSNALQFTPDHGNQLPTNSGYPGDGSPLPRHVRDRANFGLSDNMRGSPILSSSYAAEEGGSLLTPAPVRRYPYLAPPSTAQRPSQHMATSSPAPFWRWAALGSNTPLRPPFDPSPIKDTNPNFGIPSSSPAPRRDSGGSPSKKGGEIKSEMPEVEDGLDEEPAFDLTRGFMKISNYHSSASVPVANAARSHA